jgi:hypothetical protein
VTNVSVPISSLLAENPIRPAERNLEQCLDALQERGVLQAANRLSIESLLNPDEE